MNTKHPNIAIILVNYNGYQDTIECVKSLLQLHYPNFTIFLIDNNSTNDSTHQIEKFLSSDTNLQYKSIQKNNTVSKKNGEKIVFIHSNKNLGFGGGNNIAVKIATNFDKFDYFWLLNTDTKVFENTLKNLVTTAMENPQFGFLASILLYHSNPNLIQSAGVKFYPALGMGKHLLNKKHISTLKKLPNSVKKCTLVPATALLVKREAWEQTKGFDDKNFFMYGEDTDLILRGIKKGFKTGIVKNSLVLHKKNASTKDNRNKYYQFLYKSHIILIKKHYFNLYCITCLIPIFVVTLLQTKSVTKTVFALKGWFQGIKYKLKQ
jgi:GT2 family glycosyltransferase